MDYDGYDICFDHVGYSYEDGERQRISIARAFHTV